ncbi:MFS transporter [Xanthomonas translucens]|uniref:MFS transporter n=1 Tax=Xanthomonas campestris pv. translucens TaxID=343 RepID=UPI003CCDBCB8
MMRVLRSVLAAHYLAAFTALGMPLFMPRVLAQLAPHSPDWLVGVLYVLPTICTALTAATWGRLADRYGRKLSLVRALLGLAFGFALAGLAPNLPVFILALIIQGGCGGSLAAANAYLSTQVQGPALSRSLDWTQFSARLAMVTAPALLGLATDRGLAQGLYTYLAALPLLGLLLAIQLPPDSVAGTPGAADARSAAKPDQRHGARLWGLLSIQFLYYFSVVITFPYFLVYCRTLGIADDSMAGLIYSLPHLVYLILMPWLKPGKLVLSHWALLGGLAVLTGASLCQAWLKHAGPLLPVRVLYGVGMTLTIIGLNRAISECAKQGATGRLFGVFDACGKWSGTLGGVIAGVLMQRYGPAMPFVASTLAGIGALIVAAFVFLINKRPGYVPARHT